MGCTSSLLLPHPLSRGYASNSSRYGNERHDLSNRGARHALRRLCRSSRLRCTVSLASSCTTAASSQTCCACWHVASAVGKRTERCRCLAPLALVCDEGRKAKKTSGVLPCART